MIEMQERKLKNGERIFLVTGYNGQEEKQLKRIQPYRELRRGGLAFPYNSSNEAAINAIISRSKPEQQAENNKNRSIQEQRNERYKKQQEAKQKRLEEKRLRDEREAERVQFAKDLQNDINSRRTVEASDCICDQLMNHQKAGVLIARQLDRYAFFYDTGTGKTVMALEIMAEEYENHGSRFLIISPKPVIKAAWLEDQQKFFPHMRIFPFSRNMNPVDYRTLGHGWWRADGKRNDALFHAAVTPTTAEEYQEKLLPYAQHFIINPQLFLTRPEEYLSLCRPLSGIIVDESVMLKNPATAYYKAMEKAVRKVRFLYLLSGKPAPNRFEDYYSQIRLIKPNIDLPRFADEDKFYNDQRQRKEYAKAVSRFSITVSKEDCFDLPKITYIRREIDLNPKAMSTYRNMRYSQYQELEWIEPDQRTEIDNIVFITHLRKAIAKLRQIAGGFIINSDDETGATSITDIHTDKLNELLRIIDDLGESQAIIWCCYQHENELICKELAKNNYTYSTAYGKTKDLDKSIDDFRNTRVQLLVANPQTLKYGVTLVNCCYAVYYSLDFSYDNFYQSRDRIYRKGQTRPCSYIFLLANQTIDNTIYQCIMNKHTQTEINEMMLKHLNSAE